MTFKRSAWRSSASRGLFTAGLGAKFLVGTAALAAGAALVSIEPELAETLIDEWVVDPLADAGLIGNAYSDEDAMTTIAADEEGTAMTALAIAEGSQNATAAPKTKVGINLSKPFYWTGNRSFMNLLAGDKWHLRIVGQKKAVNVPAELLDANNNVVRLNVGQSIAINLATPAPINKGKSVDILCRWEGIGNVAFATNVNVTSPSYGRNTARFTWIAKNDEAPELHILSIDPADPLRKLDCREADADPEALYDPTFLASARRYHTLRYMWWQRTIDNLPVSWATRTTPDAGLIVGTDGVSIEHMIALANQTKTNAWFSMPWNADEAYYRNFAELVRDRLDPSLTVYVEVSNEVWNGSYSVTRQATAEGTLAGFAKPLPYRLAQKTGQVMDIWRAVFAGQESRLVRILANQHTMPSRMREMLEYGDTATKIDAIATAPYFPFNLDKEKYDPSNLGAIFSKLRSKIDLRMETALEQKALADKYGKRFIAYEGGQHVTGDALNVNYRLQHDSRMGKQYNYYLDRWQAVAGDLIMLFEDVNGARSPYGMFGQLDYPGQPLSQAPKENAVRTFMATIDND